MSDEASKFSGLAGRLVPREGVGNPRLVCMAGIPGAGKTTFLARARGLLPVDPYWHDPDRIMEQLPVYAEVLRRSGVEAAYETAHGLARDIADGVLYPLAVSRRVDIVMDMGFARPEIFRLVTAAREAGYRVETHFVHCDAATAGTRAGLRDRHVPQAVIAERRAFLAGHSGDIERLSDAFFAYDNRRLDAPFVPISAEHLRQLLSDDG